MPSAFGDLNGSGNQQVWVNIARTSQNIAGNYSTYSAEIRYYGNGYGSWSGSTFSWSGNFGGYAVSGNFSIPQSEAYQTYKTLWSGSFNKTHAADGTLAAFGCSASIDTSHSSIGDGTASTTEPAPPTIARTSVPSWDVNASVTTSVPKTIYTNRATTAFTHDFTWDFGALKGQTTGFSPQTGAGGTTVWTPPDSMVAQIPNAVSGTGFITCVTKNGSTVIGSKTLAFTLTANISIIPTISGISFVDDNATVVSIVGAYVQSLSKIKGTVNSAGVYGSTMTGAHTWGIPSQSVNVVSGAEIVPTVAGSAVPVQATAIDSRARSAVTYSGTLNILAYTAPWYNSVQVRRATALGTLAELGEQLQLDLNCASQSLVVGTQKNGLTIKVFTRIFGSNATWDPRNVINVAAGTVTYNSAVLITGGPYSKTQSYEIKLEITDKLTATPSYYFGTVSTGQVFMHWSSTGVGIGKYHENGSLDVLGRIYQNNGQSMLGSGDVASSADVLAATSNVLFVSPLALSGRVASESKSGLAEIATKAEFRASTDDTKFVTPKKAFDVPRFRVEGTGGVGQSIPLSGWTLISTSFPAAPQFNYEVGTWSNTNGTLTITTTGFYRIFLTLGLTTVAGASRIMCRITKNVAAESPLANTIGAMGGYGVNGINLMAGAYLVAGDVCRIYVFHDGAVRSVDSNQLTYYEYEWIRPTAT